MIPTATLPPQRARRRADARCSTSGWSTRCSTCAAAASTSPWSRSRRSRSSPRARPSSSELAYRIWQLRRDALALAVRCARRPGRRVAARAIPLEAVAGGGDGIQALRQGDARVAAGAVALLAAAALAAYPRCRTCDRWSAALALGAWAWLVLSLGGSRLIRRAARVGLAAARRRLWLPARRRGRRARPCEPASRPGFLLVAELAYWALEPRVAAWTERRRRRAAAAPSPRSSSARPCVAALVLVAVAATRRRRRSRSRRRRRSRRSAIVAGPVLVVRRSCAGASVRIVPRWRRCFRPSAVSGA